MIVTTLITLTVFFLLLSQVHDVFEPEECAARDRWCLGAGRVRVRGAHLHTEHPPAAQAGGVSRGRHRVHEVRAGPDARVRHHLIVHQLLHTVRGDDRHLLPTVPVRAEARAEHPGGHPTADHHDHHDHHGRRVHGHADSRPPPHVAVPRERPQGRYHGGRDHGHVPAVLGAVLLRQHHRGVLQDVHTRGRVQGAHVARLLKLGVQPNYILDIQHRVPGRVPPHTHHPLPGLVLLQGLPDGGAQLGQLVPAKPPPEAYGRRLRLRIDRLCHGRDRHIHRRQTERQGHLRRRGHSRRRRGAPATGMWRRGRERASGHQPEVVGGVAPSVAAQLVRKGHHRSRRGDLTAPRPPSTTRRHASFRRRVSRLNDHARAVQYLSCQDVTLYYS